jgi:hypothetical protein
MTLSLLVGIKGGFPHLPKYNVRLGDVVVGAPEDGPAVVQYDLGKQSSTGFEISRTLNKPPATLMRVVNNLEIMHAIAEDSFFDVHLQRFNRYTRFRDDYLRPQVPAEYDHEAGQDCSSHDTVHQATRATRDLTDIRFHYSAILSGDQVMKSAVDRDQIGQGHGNAFTSRWKQRD